MSSKTIDINALEWFDKVNGNSYFAGTVTIDFGLPTERQIHMPFQYGYGSQYVQEAMSVLIQSGEITDARKYSSGGTEALWSYCQDRGIILRQNKHENCLKRELTAIPYLRDKKPRRIVKR